MDTDKKLLLVDGYALIYRSYFAFINRPIRDSTGRNVSAVFGFFRTLFALMKEYSPEYVAVAMDSITPTFRHTMYPQYKATRDKTPEDLHAQIPIIERALEAAGVKSIREEGLEADDLIATLSRSCTSSGISCLILSGDKDLMQLVDDRIHMLRPVKGEYLRFDPSAVTEHFGITPQQIIDYLALIGDSSDNVPGVKGIGPKGAVKLLAEYGSLEGIYEHIDSIASGTAKKLREFREDALLSKRLVKLQDDASCEAVKVEEFAASRVDWSRAVPVFQEIQSASLVEAAGGSSLEVRTARKGSNAASEDGQTVAMQPKAQLGGKGSYSTVRNLEQLDEILSSARRAGSVAFDIETDSIDEMQAVPVGFSIAWEPRKACYIPIKAGGAEQLPAADVHQRLKDFLEDETIGIIGQNFKYDYKVLRRWGIKVANVAFDTMIAAWLLDATAQSYSMDRLAARYLDYTTIKYNDIVPRGSLFPDVALEQASEYAAEDADITFRLHLLFSRMLEERELETLFHETEMPLLTVLAEMELHGMLLEGSQLADYAVELRSRLDEITREIYDLCGHEFNINSTRQLQEVLFSERGLQPVKKTKTGYSTNIAVLEELSGQDPVPRLILEHRSLEKLRNTYVEALPGMINPDTGRLHTTLIQTGTATGRLSSKNPNLQNIPVRSADGRRIRSAFIPREGSTLLSADYSQIELVVLAHFSGDPGLLDAFRSGVDVHTYTGSLIFGVPMEAVTADQRRIAKTINFGVMYGMSAFRLSNELNIPRSDAARFIDAYFQRYAGVRNFIDRLIEQVGEEGRATTLLGHQRAIPAIRSRNRNERMGAERIAVNTPIQGTAADIIKRAMLDIDREIRSQNLASRMVLQVHDELIFEVPLEEVDTMRGLVRRVMEHAVELQLPLRVSIETGASWGDFH